MRADDTQFDRNIENIAYAISSNVVRNWLPALKSGFVEDVATFEIKAGKTRELGFNLASRTRLYYQFKANPDLKFRISDPSGNWMIDKQEVRQEQGEMKATDAGQYALIFDNASSIFASKTVNLRYKIVPAGCPIPDS